MTIKHRGQSDPECGFTLVEVLVALSLFMILAVGMLAISSEAYYRDALHRDTLTATALAKSKVEELVRARYDDPLLSDPDGGHDVGTDALGDPENFRRPDHADEGNPLDAVGETAGLRKFTRVWNVGEGIPVPGVKTITVIVGWQDQRGRQQFVSQTIQLARLK